MIPTYCINLADNKARAQNITTQLSAQSIAFTLVEAVYGRNMSWDEACQQGYLRKQRLKHHQELALPEIACLLSHRKCLELFIASGEPFGVVLEDDVHIAPNFMTHIEAICAEVSNWDVVKLQSFYNKVEGVSIGNTSSGLEVFATSKAFRGTIGLLYSRSGAIKLKKTLKKFTYPIDIMLGFSWRNKIKIIAVNPSLVDIAEFDSNIPVRGTLRFNKTIWSQLVKPFFKRYQSIRRRLWCWRTAKTVTMKKVSNK